MFNPWDAPLDFQAQLLEEGDPAPTEINEPPREICDLEDPDELLTYRVAYAAQVMQLDLCVGAIAAAIEELSANTETLVMIAGSRGMALGEHRSVGLDAKQLYSERLHIPWLAYQNSTSQPQPRYRHLAQPMDISATLTAWFKLDTNFSDACDSHSLLPKLETEETSRSPRQSIIACSEHEQQMIRTPAWQMLVTGTGKDRSCQLFSKPDDRWESNDISKLCPDVLQQLLEELTSTDQG